MGDEEASRALSGVRALDLTHQVAGPSATLMLAFLGAEVVKVIAPGSRDSYDATPFYLNNASKKSIEHAPGVSALIRANRQKRSWIACSRMATMIAWADPGQLPQPAS
jgi:crotonobetainyl-CoA:carnitine CoA-transferase CaiB-like acyl-CoA transferase